MNYKVVITGIAITVVFTGVAMYSFNGGTLPPLTVGVISTVLATLAAVATIAIQLQEMNK